MTRSREILFWVVLVIVSVAFVESLLDEHKGNRSWRHADEVYWAGEGFYFTLFFVDHDMASPAWSEFWAVLNPPLVKYVYGFALATAGHPVTDRSLRRNFDDNWNDPETLWANVPPGVIRICRTTSSLFGLLAAALVFGIATLVANRWLGILALLYMSRDGLLMHYFYSAMSEPVAITLLCLFLFTCLWFFRKDRNVRENPRGWLLAILGVSVSIGLLALAKPNGPFAGIAFAMVGLVFWGHQAFARNHGGILDALASVSVAGILSIAILVAFNPYLYPNPPKRLADTVIAWQEHISDQRQSFTQVRLDGAGERITFVADYAFPCSTRPNAPKEVKPDPRTRPLNATLLLLGVAALLRIGIPRTVQRKLLAPELVFLALALLYATVFLLWVPLAWKRYALVLHPFTIVLQAAAAWFVLGLGLRLARRVLPFLPDPGPIRTWTGNDREAPEGVSG